MFRARWIRAPGLESWTSTRCVHRTCPSDESYGSDVTLTYLTWCGGAAYGESVRAIRNDMAADDSVLVSQIVSSIAASMSGHLRSVVEDLRERLLREIDYLDGDERLLEVLTASLEANIGTLTHILRHGIAASNAETPPAAVEYARRLAQRGIPVSSLVRCYRLGQDSFLRWCLEELKRYGGEAHVVSATALELVGITSAYIDLATQRMVAEYEDERDRWALNQGAVRAGRVRDLLDGRDVDLESAEVALDYGFRQQHLGLVVWGDREQPGDSPLPALERMVRSLGQRMGCLKPPLFVPVDELSAWVWLPLGQRTVWDNEVLAEAAEAVDRPIRVAVGAPGGGVRGFRRSHRQASQAQAVVVAGQKPAPSVTGFEEVGHVALMCNDIEETRAWVADILGALALDDEPHARLRETVRVFLSSGGSYAAAAAHLGMHKNSVQYRLRKAEEVLGRPVREDRLNLELALSACCWLGKTVLLPKLG